MHQQEQINREYRWMLGGMAALTAVSFAVLVLAGCAPLNTGFSLLIGLAYALLWFWMVICSAQRAVRLPPGLGRWVVRRGYLLRYGLTGIVILAAIRLPWVQPVAMVLPLFFPRLLLVWNSAFRRRGG